MLKVLARGYQVEFNGEIYSKGSDGYYEGESSNSYGKKLLHKEVYRDYHGSIPFGAFINHMDGNKDNFEINNLEPLSRNEALILIRKKASDWHSSEEGRDWHKRHYGDCKDKLHEKTYSHVCENCGEEYLS